MLRLLVASSNRTGEPRRGSGCAANSALLRKLSENGSASGVVPAARIRMMLGGVGGSGNQPTCGGGFGANALRKVTAKAFQSRVSDGAKNAKKPGNSRTPQVCAVSWKVGSVRVASENRNAMRALSRVSDR
jgi:hypothetical protein